MEVCIIVHPNHKSIYSCIQKFRKTIEIFWFTIIFCVMMAWNMCNIHIHFTDTIRIKLVCWIFNLEKKSSLIGKKYFEVKRFKNFSNKKVRLWKLSYYDTNIQVESEWGGCERGGFCNSKIVLSTIEGL